MTILAGKVECNIPRKRTISASQHDKGLNKFYEQVLQAVLRHIRFDVVKCILIASPGFVKVRAESLLMQRPSVLFVSVARRSLALQC